MFIDFRQVFDSVNMQAVIEDSMALGAPRKLSSLIKVTLNNMHVKVFKHDGE